MMSSSRIIRDRMIYQLAAPGIVNLLTPGLDSDALKGIIVDTISVTCVPWADIQVANALAIAETGGPH